MPQAAKGTGWSREPLAAMDCQAQHLISLPGQGTRATHPGW